MKNEITLVDFILLLVELLIFFLLMSKGGMTIYRQEEIEMGYVSDDITISASGDETPRKRPKEYFELPNWLEEMKTSVSTFVGNLKSDMSNVRLTVYILKSFILFTMTGWIIYLLVHNSNFRGENVEIQVLILIKHFLIWFFLLSGLISVLGALQADVFWDYGEITTLQQARRYISIKQLPLLLALIIGVVSLIYIKFKKTAKPPAHKKEHPVHH